MTASAGPISARAVPACSAATSPSSTSSSQSIRSNACFRRNWARRAAFHFLISRLSRAKDIPVLLLLLGGEVEKQGPQTGVDPCRLLRAGGPAEVASAHPDRACVLGGVLAGDLVPDGVPDAAAPVAARR